MTADRNTDTAFMLVIPEKAVLPAGRQESTNYHQR